MTADFDAELAEVENALAVQQCEEIERLTQLVRDTHREYVLVKSTLHELTAENVRVRAALAAACEMIGVYGCTIECRPRCAPDTCQQLATWKRLAGET